MCRKPKDCLISDPTMQGRTLPVETELMNGDILQGGVAAP